MGQNDLLSELISDVHLFHVPRHTRNLPISLIKFTLEGPHKESLLVIACVLIATERHDHVSMLHILVSQVVLIVLVRLHRRLSEVVRPFEKLVCPRIQAVIIEIATLLIDFELFRLSVHHGEQSLLWLRDQVLQAAAPRSLLLHRRLSTLLEVLTFGKLDETFIGV